MTLLEGLTEPLSRLEVDALRLTIKVAFWSVLGAILPAIGIASLLSRGRFRGQATLDAVVHLPLVLPPVVIGYLLLLLFSTNGPLGVWLEHSRRS